MCFVFCVFVLCIFCVCIFVCLWCVFDVMFLCVLVYSPLQTEKGDIVDPYVRVEVRGAPCDERAWKTDVVDNNGFHPVWNASKEV